MRQLIRRIITEIRDDLPEFWRASAEFIALSVFGLLVAIVITGVGNV